MQTQIGLDLSVMLAMAVGFISGGRPETMRSLVGNARAVRIAA